MPISLADFSEALSQVVEQVGRSVVRVEGGRRRPVSGLVWTERQVVTVAHGIHGDRAEVTVDGVTHQATVKGVDESTDLALLELPAGVTLTAVRRVDRALKVGELALRVGRPGETVRATSGIVSTVGRQPFRSDRGGQLDFFLDVDAPHQPGFSGGPLVDLQGGVIGLTSSGLVSGRSIGIPTRTIERVVTQLAAHGRVRRSYLGLQLQPVQLPGDVRQSTGEEVGLLVTAVEPGGPAQRAGILYGDTVLHLGDDTVRTLPDLYAYLRADHGGEEVPVKFFRNGQVMKQQVRLDAR